MRLQILYKKDDDGSHKEGNELVGRYVLGWHIQSLGSLGVRDGTGVLYGRRASLFLQITSSGLPLGGVTTHHSPLSSLLLEPLFQ